MPAEYPSCLGIGQRRQGSLIGNDQRGTRLEQVNVVTDKCRRIGRLHGDHPLINGDTGYGMPACQGKQGVAGAHLNGLN